MDYIIGDIHGYFQAFVTMIETINLGANDTLHIIGDVVDRGEQPIDILQLVMKEKNMRFILGNHEDMMLNYIKEGATERWMRNGCQTTLLQWERLSGAQRLEIADFLDTRSLYEKLDRFLLVHSGIKMPEEIPGTRLSTDQILALQTRNDLVWSREAFFNRSALGDMTIIFGHTSTTRICATREQEAPTPPAIWHDDLYHDKIGIDCGSYRPDGRLACLRLDDLQEFYVPTHGE